ncbi:MAG: SRPBCC family protein, partial [Caldilineaceae bacterium]
ILRDYVRHHPQILPDSFTALTVEDGGIGAGTVFVLGVTVFGRTQQMRMVVDEPEPGHVLMESDASDGTVTTFTVVPDRGGQSMVTIETTWQPAAGMSAIVDRGVKPHYLRRLYRQELRNLDKYARGLSQADRT